MLTYDELSRNYWRYYLLLEDKFLQTLHYVELTEDNFFTYSIEYAYLIQSIGSELDSFFKIYCDFPLQAYKTIIDYKETVFIKYPDITSEIIRIDDYGLEFAPFSEWNSSTPKWWKSFTSIKHNRSSTMKSASLDNVLNILSALFLLEMKYFNEIADTVHGIDIPEQQSKLFSLPYWIFRAVPSSEAFLHFMKILDRFSHNDSDSLIHKNE